LHESKRNSAFLQVPIIIGVLILETKYQKYALSPSYRNLVKEGRMVWEDNGDGTPSFGEKGVMVMTG
jgi:hypothetical protein